MLKHKRALHKYSRAKLDCEFLEECKNISQKIAFVAGQDGDQFLCVTKDGAIEFHALADEDEKVVHYLKLMEKKHCCEIIEDVKGWVNAK